MTVSSPPQDRAPLYSRLKFLVIDNFEHSCRGLKQILQATGAKNIDTASDCRQAVYRCTYERYDIVLCSLAGDHGRNGPQVLEELRHRKLLKQTSAFVLITAEASRDIVMSSCEHQPDTHIGKPVTRALLEKRIQALIEQQQALYPVNHALDLENLPAAVALCHELLPELPRYRSRLLQILADTYRRIGDYSHAHEIYAEVLRSRDLRWARLGMAKVLIGEQKWSLAIAQLEQFIADVPDCVEAYDCLARAQQEDGQDLGAQKTLEAAVRIAPAGYLRQQHLALVALRNQDLEAAAEAWRKTIDLGDHSLHSAPDPYLHLGRCLYDLSTESGSDTGRRYADEALRVLQQMQRRFRVNAAAQASAMLIAARIHTGQNRGQEAQRLLEAVRDTLVISTVSATTGLELARTLYSMNQTAEAQDLLVALSGRFGAEPDIMQEIEVILAEPTDTGHKIQVRAAHRQGLVALAAGRMDEAAEAFAKALELAPRHPDLNLNLVQALLKSPESAQDGTDDSTLQRCTTSLDRIAHLPLQHRQYQQYLALRERVAALKNPWALEDI